MRRWRGGGRGEKERDKGLVEEPRGGEAGSKILGKSFLGGVGASARAGPRARSLWIPTCTLQITARNYLTRFRCGRGSAEGIDLPEVTEAADGAPRGLHRQQWDFSFLWVGAGDGKLGKVKTSPSRTIPSSPGAPALHFAKLKKFF